MTVKLTKAAKEGWFKHEGGPNPLPGHPVDLIWGFGIIEAQPSDKVNWRFYWDWKPSFAAGRAALSPTPGGETS